MTTAVTASLNGLFDLVAPIAITGGADCCFMDKAKAAWKQIVSLPNLPWKAFGCPVPHDEFEKPGEWDLDDNDDFQQIYDYFAKPAYDALFEEIVNQNGDDKWDKRIHDYWGAKGYERPGDNPKSLSLAGDGSGQYPWYETADLLIDRIKKREKERP